MLNNLKIGARLGATLSIIVILLLAVIAAGAYNLSRYVTASGWNTHTYQVLAETQDALEALVNIETGQRGFLVAGKDEFLEPLNTGKVAFLKHFDQAKKLTADNPTQQDRLNKLKEHYEIWLRDSVESSISKRRTIGNNFGRFEEITSVVGTGKTQMDSMRRVFSELDAAERSLLDSREKEMESMSTTTQRTLLFGGILGALLAIVLARQHGHAQHYGSDQEAYRRRQKDVRGRLQLQTRHRLQR